MEIFDNVNRSVRDVFSMVFVPSHAFLLLRLVFHSKNTIRDYIESDAVPFHKDGRQYKFRVSEVDAWIKSSVSADIINRNHSEGKKKWLRQYRTVKEQHNSQTHGKISV